MTIRLDDQVAIVTGAGRGLGRAHALALAERGARVVVNDLAEADAQQVAEEIRDTGGTAMGVACNVAEAKHVEEMVSRVMMDWKRVDILVNNAGILRDKTFHKMSLDEFRLVIDVHLMGSFYCTKAVWEIMREQKYGRVLFTSSSTGLYGNFGQSNYGAAKMAMVGLMNTLHLEGDKYNIRVNALAPGYFLTDVSRILLESTMSKTFVNGIPMRRVGEFPDLDGPLLLLASDASRYMTGSVLVVDGGHICASL